MLDLYARENQPPKRENMIYSMVKENGTENCKITEIRPRKDVEFYLSFSTW